MVQTFNFFCQKFRSFIGKIKKIQILISCSKNNRKYLVIAVKYVEDSEIRISFIKDFEIIDVKADTMYWALSSEIKKCGGVWFESDAASVNNWA